ncbi:MAG TPA: hypothetical protein VLX56_01540 [Nitrososphaerales archaeon]|nr:hypothetical protein [Nitrososphaerales archaeon]
MNTIELSKRFLNLATFNVVLSIIFTAVVLDPFLCVSVSPGQFGCHDNMVTSWPGTWLFIGYFTWLIVGVIGAFGWSGMWYLGNKLRGKTEVNSLWARLQLIIYEVGVLGATATMAAIGYVGGGVVASGGGAAVAAEAIALDIFPPLSNDPSNIFNDMPVVVEAGFIAIALLSIVLGVLIYVNSKSTGGESA